MNADYPHEIRRFADGDEANPEGSIPLTEEQFKILDPMTPDERAEWVEANGVDALLAHLAGGGFVEEKVLPDPEHERRSMLRLQDALLRRQGAQSHSRGPAPPITPRAHRRQGR